MAETNGFNLGRFVDAQRGVYDSALQELRNGEKRSHWMWFIFPQIAGLGSSSMAQRYAITGLDEAIVYLRHPILGPRLHEVTVAVNAVQDRSLLQIFGSPDDMKFHSSMTLFAAASTKADPRPAVFEEALRRWFDGANDERTIGRLRST